MIETAELRSCPDVLGNLLHALCQPLTTLRCSLELSLDQFTQAQSEPVSAALEQADRAIETVRLIREYLELQRGMKPVGSVALAPAVHAVLAQLAVVAEAHRVPLFALGESSATLTVNEFWLQRAFRYLVGPLIEIQAPGSAIAVLLEDHGFGSVVSVHRLSFPQFAGQGNNNSRVAGRLLQAQIGIAQRVFESAGASLEVYTGERPGFSIRFPRPKPLTHKMSA